MKLLRRRLLSLSRRALLIGLAIALANTAQAAEINLRLAIHEERDHSCVDFSIAAPQAVPADGPRFARLNYGV